LEGINISRTFYVHEAETEWINGGFPLTIEQVRDFLTEEPCDFPKDFDVNKYHLFKGVPTRVLKDGDTIELGKRTIQILHTPGHSPGSMCFYEKDNGYLYTGDLIYIGELFAYYPSTDPIAYMNSIKKLSAIDRKKNSASTSRFKCSIVDYKRYGQGFF
jgi:Zn-dependent hydrolases, including glyoxylases